jgi:hypothetical protein
LDEGLESPYAENILRELDADGVVGLKTADDQVLSDIRVRTRGFPRALEAFYGTLSADRSTTLEELLSRAADALLETVVETLAGEAFSRLDRTAQLVMQALPLTTSLLKTARHALKSSSPRSRRVRPDSRRTSC